MTNAETPPVPLPDVLTPDQVAAFLAMPKATIWAALRRGEIPAAFVARRYRVRREDVLALFGTRRGVAIEPAPTGPPLVLPDRVERLGRPGRPRKPRRRSAVRPPGATDRASPSPRE